MVGILGKIRCLTHATNVAKAFPERFSCGNERRWMERLKGGASESSRTERGIEIESGATKWVH